MENNKLIKDIVKEAVEKVINESRQERLYESVRNAVRPIVYEEVVKYISETLNEKEEKDSENKSKEDEKSKRISPNKMRQVLKLLNQDKVDMAAIARKLYPDMSDDTRRSLISKKSRGERPLNDTEATEIYRLLRTTDN